MKRISVSLLLGLLALTVAIIAMRNNSDPEPKPQPASEVKEGPFAWGRVAAAQGLHEHGRPEGVTAMIVKWNGSRPAPPPGAGKKPGAPEGPDDGLYEVAAFLAGCGKVEAITALGKDLPGRPVSLRLAVVRAFAESGSMAVLATRRGGLQPVGMAVRDQPDVVRAAVEGLLVSALDDTEERTGMGGTWNGKRFSNPRICDAAGHMLNQLAPDRYPFDLSAPLPQRDRSRFELKNVWRKSQGLPPLPPPAP